MPGRDGKGPSRGNGLGTGRGRGKDRGSGRGFGMGIGQGMFQRKMSESIIPHAVQPQPQSQPFSQQSLSKEHELDLLKQQAQVLHRQADSILHRIEELNKGKQNISERGSFVRVSVIIEKCTGCGICIDACNRDAITVNNVVEIDPEKCSGCGDCVDMCPNGALILK